MHRGDAGRLGREIGRLMKGKAVEAALATDKHEQTCSHATTKNENARIFTHHQLLSQFLRPFFNHNLVLHRAFAAVSVQLAVFTHDSMHPLSHIERVGLRLTQTQVNL